MRGGARARGVRGVRHETDISEAEAEALFVARPDLLEQFVAALVTVVRDACSLARTAPPMFVEAG